MSEDSWGLEIIGKAFVPKRFRPNLRSYFLKAGVNQIPYQMFGVIFYITLVLTSLLYFGFIFRQIEGRSVIVILLATFIFWVVVQIILALVSISLIYFFTDIRIYNRTRKMEEILPDFLQVLSSNLKGGMSFEKALWSSINPRFSVLSEEIAMAAKKVMTGEDVETALNEFVQKYDSPTLRRTIELIISEIEGGGKISEIIDKTVENLRQTKELNEEMAASVLTYVIFITVIVIVIAPGLFALSYNLLIITQGFASKLAGDVGGAGGVSMFSGFQGFSSKAEMAPMFEKFSYACLFVIAVFSSMIVSSIQKGSIKGGMKFMPLFIAGSLFFYTVFMKILISVFGGMSF